MKKKSRIGKKRSGGGGGTGVFTNKSRHVLSLSLSHTHTHAFKHITRGCIDPKLLILVKGYFVEQKIY